MRALAIIPARSGSKGLKDKNILPLGGKPLLAYSVEAAVDSGCFDTVFLSTDSESYARIGARYGTQTPFLRSAAAASDTASSWDAVREALAGYSALGKEFDFVMLLQPTSPLRISQDICAAFALIKEKQAHAVVSVCEAEHAPQACKPLPADGCLADFVKDADHVRRQDVTPCYRINGAIYLLDVPWFLRNGMCYDASVFAYIMPQERSLDIDTEVDLVFAGAMLQYKSKTK